MDSNKKLNTCVALGLFDGVHLGHRAVIEKAVKAALEKNLVPTAFTFSNGAVAVKGTKPIISDDDKCRRLKELGIENVCTVDFEDVRELSPTEFFEKILIERLGCRVIVCGYDFRFGKKALGDTQLLRELCAKNGTMLIVVDKVTVDGMVASSTAIREAVSRGEISLANTLLGYRLSYKNEILHGRQLGRKMDCPTVNQKLPGDVATPKFGVYLSEIEIDGTVYKGLTNIGVKPTVTDCTEPALETHILGFEGDAYGKEAILYPCKFLREEKKFSSIDELSAQIKNDIKLAIG